jgi:FkbM family methyltransferase
LIFWGFYERPELQFVQKYLPSTLDVVELGSSIGVVSAQIARRLTTGRQLVCVEANPGAVRLLRENTSRNAPSLRVSVYNNAVAYAAEQPEFADISFGNSNLAAWISHPSEQHKGCRLGTATLHDLLVRHGIGFYALVSDIEGAEAGLLFFDAQSLENCRLLIIELHTTEFQGRKLSVSDLAGFITDHLGFALKDKRRDVYVFTK